VDLFAVHRQATGFGLDRSTKLPGDKWAVRHRSDHISTTRYSNSQNASVAEQLVLRTQFKSGREKIHRYLQEHHRKHRITRALNFPVGAQMGTSQVISILQELPVDGNLLVWGLGNDSPFWNNATTGRVAFLEDDIPLKKAGALWYDTITEKYPELEAYKVHYKTDNND
jgi:hypothetical protein